MQKAIDKFHKFHYQNKSSRDMSKKNIAHLIGYIQLRKLHKHHFLNK